jgi:hypothetical protein
MSTPLTLTPTGTGGDFPKREGNSPGRTREANPFDEYFLEAYDTKDNEESNGIVRFSADALAVAFAKEDDESGEDALKRAVLKARSSAQFLEMGLDVAVTETEVVFRVRDKRERKSKDVTPVA